MGTLPASVVGDKHLLLQTPIVKAPEPPPESLCSLNGFFRVAGYERDFQATGRGTTGKEAASNLRDCIKEAKARLEAPQLVSDEEKLGRILACGIQKAVARDDFGLIERLAKAAALVAAKKVERGEREGLLCVRSATDGALWYEVTGTECSCQDYQHRHKGGDKAYYCKHALSAMMYRKIHSI